MYKTVIRLMNNAGQMLGWAETQVHARGDGNLWIEIPVAIMVTEDGTVDHILSHWTDANVAVKNAIPNSPLAVEKGMGVIIDAPRVLFHLGEPAGGLPPVTVGNTSITVPTGSLGAVGN